jgi:hypothetical protein
MEKIIKIHILLAHKKLLLLLMTSSTVRKKRRRKIYTKRVVKNGFLIK